MAQSPRSPEATPEVSLAALRVGLSSSFPQERLLALNALMAFRGDEAGQLAGRAMGDADLEVATRAREVRDRIAEDTRLFGAGALLRLEIPPPLRSPSEAATQEQKLWMLWGAGGVVIVTLLGIQEHSGSLIAPLIAVFFVMLALFWLTMRLRRELPSPGWVFFDPADRQVIVETSSATGQLTRSKHAFDAVAGLEVGPEAPPAHPVARAIRSGASEAHPDPGGPVERGSDQAQDPSYLLEVRLQDGSTLALARRDNVEDLQRIQLRLSALTGL